MKARLPQGYGSGGQQNLQQLARQAQKMQNDMEAATEELNAKEYTASAGGGKQLCSDSKSCNKGLHC